MTILYRNAFILLSLLLLASCGGEDKSAAPSRGGGATSVRVTKVVEKEVSFYKRFPATVVALEEVEVRPQVSGYITRRHFKEGDYVRRGQQLFTVDVRRYIADVERAEAQVASAKAQLDLSQKDVARYRRLAEAEAVAVQTLERAETQLEADRQAVVAAQAAVASATTQLDYASIRAPMSGLTSLQTVKVGTQVSPGNPVLTIISQKEPIGVDFALPQSLISRLAELEQDPASMPDSTFRLRLSDGSVYDKYGRIYASGRTVDPRTGTLNVRLEFDNENNALRTGMSLELEMLNRQYGQQLLIPRQAMSEQMGEFFVYVKKDSIVTRQKITTGAKIRENIIVTSGLEAGQEVVYEGVKALKDSAKVRVVPSTPRQTPANSRPDSTQSKGK